MSSDSQDQASGNSSHEVSSILPSRLLVTAGSNAADELNSMESDEGINSTTTHFLTVGSLIRH